MSPERSNVQHHQVVDNNVAISEPGGSSSDRGLRAWVRWSARKPGLRAKREGLASTVEGSDELRK